VLQRWSPTRPRRVAAAAVLAPTARSGVVGAATPLPPAAPGPMGLQPAPGWPGSTRPHPACAGVTTAARPPTRAGTARNDAPAAPPCLRLPPAAGWPEPRRPNHRSRRGRRGHWAPVRAGMAGTGTAGAAAPAPRRDGRERSARISLALGCGALQSRPRLARLLRGKEVDAKGSGRSHMRPGKVRDGYGRRQSG
jgi:hypothetical protein